MLKGKTALVTGSTSGIGLGIAKSLARQGANILLNGFGDVDGPRAEVLEAGKASGIQVDFHGADMSRAAEIEDLFKHANDKLGGIDIVVNNACNQGIGPAFEEMDPAYFLSVIKTNLMGTFQVSQEAVKMMLRQESRGVIVNLGSNVSTRAIRNRTAYVASKGGLDALTRAMAVDLGPKGIRVNMVAPGYIFTDRWEKLADDKVKRRRLNCPIGLEATADDIAQAVAFMASDASRNICGERLVVDAGCSAQHMPVDVDV